MILKPIDNTFVLPIINTPSDVFKYIAEFNGYNFFETDLTGYTPNDIPQDIFFCDKIDLVSPRKNTNEYKYDGILFIGVPVDIAQEVNDSTFYAGQFKSIIEEMISKEFVKQIEKYFICNNIEISLNNIRPLYNSVKYTKATNCTGVEINYSIWI